MFHRKTFRRPASDRRSLLSGPVPQLALAAVCTGYAAGAFLGWGSTGAALVMGDFGLSAAAFLAAGSCLWFAHGRAGDLRPGWALIGLSSLMIGMGNTVWAWYEVVLRQPVPRTSVADLCYLLFAPLAIVGLLMLAKRPVTRSGWIRLALDAWLIGGSLMTLSWSVALAHTAQWQGITATRAVLALAYPLLDIALVSIVLVLHFRRSAAHRAAINTVVGALVLTVMCDALFTSPLLRERYSSGQLLDAGWFAASLLLAVAPWLVGRGEDAQDQAPDLPPGPAGHVPARPVRPLAGSLAALTPYLAAAVCVLGILITIVSGRDVDRVVGFTACAVVLALLVRQGLTLLDNVQLTRELAQKENWFRSLVQGSSDVIMIADRDGTLRYVSPAASGVYGQQADRLIGGALAALIHPDDEGRVRQELRRFLSVPPVREPATRIECRVRHGDGRWLNVESTVNRHAGGLILNSRDVTERVRLQAQLEHSATHDPLTDLPNRALFTERVRHALATDHPASRAAALFFIDLDGFKAVNDSAGHQAGDELLIQAAARLRESVRAQDTTARLGGDEFAALIAGDPGDDPRTRAGRVLGIAERMRAAVARPYLIDGRELRIAASIGVALAEPGATPTALMRDADLAMYRAKQSGKDRVELYMPRAYAEHPGHAGHDRWGERRRHAPRPPEPLVLLHQPIVDLADGRVTAVSALARRPCAHGVPAQSPGPPAARRGPGAHGEQPAEITGRLLEKAIAEAAGRHLDGLTVPVAVRIPGPSLADRTLAAPRLERLLGRHGLGPGALMIEVPDAGAVLATADLSRRVADLGRLGIAIALSGIGGATGVAALQRLPVRLLRLDRHLVDGLAESDVLRTVAAALLHTAADLGIDTFADGVDTAEQAAALRALGCGEAQGLAFSGPLDAGRLRRLLAEGRVPVPGGARPLPPPRPERADGPPPAPVIRATPGPAAPAVITASAALAGPPAGRRALRDAPGRPTSRRRHAPPPGGPDTRPT
ncbi:putative bifunctional diguanylate cyclase/phosphodiesterase [Streptomyces avicenniae]|uniref:putative bifunctional diguanylate cyclase/phosphodiesterase n=1 Tax=Streptomyces avicenniae TaxID=500153 RepID=UPI000699CD11|nr:diguanylate cyclase [Streptomyces avicenniae]